MSSSEWKKYKLGEVVEVAQGLAINAKSKHLLQESGLPLLRITDLINNTQIQFINVNGAPKQSYADYEDLIYTRTGQVGLVFKGKRGIIHNNCFKVIPNKEILDPIFLYYFLYQSSIKELANAIASGSVQKDLPHSAFKSIEIDIPNIQLQKKIALILSSLDDKIELNKQTIQTLEAMAQTLFKEMCLPKKNILPKGWTKKKIFEIGKVITGKTPSSNTPEHFGEKVPFVTPTDFKNYDKIILSSYRYLSEEGLSALKNKLLPENSVLVTCIGSDMGKVAVNKKECVTNQQINAIVVDDIFTDFLYYSLINNYELLRNMSTGGSTMPMINKSQFEEIEFVTPNNETLEYFKKIIDPLNSELKNNIEETKTLTELRDNLLPKLIKGEIKL